MLWTLIVILVVLWLLGLLASIGGGLIHVPAGGRRRRPDRPGAVGPPRHRLRSGGACGPGGGSRTRMTLRPPDFESGASAIPPPRGQRSLSAVAQVDGRRRDRLSEIVRAELWRLPGIARAWGRC